MFPGPPSVVKCFLPSKLVAKSGVGVLVSLTDLRNPLDLVPSGVGSKPVKTSYIIYNKVGATQKIGLLDF